MTALEAFNKVEFELKSGHRKATDEERCPICFCDLFDDDLLTKDVKEIEQYAQKQLIGEESLDQVVLMERCTDHCFHRECLESQMAHGEYLKCAVCSVTYGVRTGDQPPGTFKWSLENLRCSGFTEKTWVVQYRFDGGIRNGH